MVVSVVVDDDVTKRWSRRPAASRPQSNRRTLNALMWPILNYSHRDEAHIEQASPYYHIFHICVF